MRTKFGLVALAAMVSLAVSAMVASSSSQTRALGRETSEASAVAEAAKGAQAAGLPPADALGLRVEVIRHSRFAWPAEGPLTSYFGAGHPTGIDIGLEPGEDSPIRASAAGTVSYAGGSACCDYGLHVIIDHDGGMSTLYGHFSMITVSEGDHVEQGDIIGLGGASGDADGKHLHFEVRSDGAWTDPLRYLPFVRESPYGGATQSVACPYQAVLVDSDSTVIVRFVPAGGAAYELEGFSVIALEPAGGVPDPDVRPQGQLGVSLAFPLLPAATGKSVQYQLEARLGSGEDQETVGCRLDLRTLQTMPNSAETLARYRAKFLTPTRTPVPTSTPRRVPTATATPAPPTKTPVVRPPTFVVPRAPTPPRTPR